MKIPEIPKHFMVSERGWATVMPAVAASSPWWEQVVLHVRWCVREHWKGAAGGAYSGRAGWSWRGEIPNRVLVGCYRALSDGISWEISKDLKLLGAIVLLQLEGFCEESIFISSVGEDIITLCLFLHHVVIWLLTFYFVLGVTTFILFCLGHHLVHAGHFILIRICSYSK